MALVQHLVDGAASGSSSSIQVAQTGALQLTISAGDWIEPDASGDLVTYSFAQEVLDFTPDLVLPKDVLVYLLHNPSTDANDVGVCGILLDASLIKNNIQAHGSPVAPWVKLATLAWFVLPTNATDLDQTTVNWLQVV